MWPDRQISFVPPSFVSPFSLKTVAPISNITGIDANDSTLLTLAFIFDINYDYSLKIIKEQKLLDNLYKKVGTKNNGLYFEYINKYIEKRINNVR